MSSSRLIDKGQLSAFERWELPNMDGRRATPKPQVEDLEPIELPTPITAEQIEAIQREAYQEGFEQGRAEGRKAGEADVQAQAQRLGQIMQGLAQPLEDLDQTLENELVGLAIALARQIVRRELAVQPDVIVSVVSEAVAQLPSSAQRIRLFLHPDDAKLVRVFLDGGQNEEERPWKIVEDAALTRGGCRVESDRSRIDARFEQRIDAVLMQMLGAERAAELTHDHP